MPFADADAGYRGPLNPQHTPSPVFPAHAGMNRAGTPAAVEVPCVPRACGDEPDKDQSTVIDALCSPRMRG